MKEMKIMNMNKKIGLRCWTSTSKHTLQAGQVFLCVDKLNTIIASTKGKWNTNIV